MWVKQAFFLFWRVARSPYQFKFKCEIQHEIFTQYFKHFRSLLSASRCECILSWVIQCCWQVLGFLYITSTKVQDRCVFLTDPELNRSTWTANYWHLQNPTISNWKQFVAFAGSCRGKIAAIIAHCKTLQFHLNCNFMHCIGRILQVQIFWIGIWIGTRIGTWL